MRFEKIVCKKEICGSAALQKRDQFKEADDINESTKELRTLIYGHGAICEQGEAGNIVAITIDFFFQRYF